MKWCTLVPAVSMVVLCSVPALAQDATKADPAHYKVVFENASVRVLKIDYAAGEKSKMHQHPDAIVVPLTTAKMRFALADGKTEERELATGAALYTPAVTHTPENMGTGPARGASRGVQDEVTGDCDPSHHTAEHGDEGPRRRTARDGVPYDR